jgi:peptide-methionine (S)-S-oxide reductase
MEDRKLETLTVGGGCFWCVEAIFQQIEGVEKVVSGYSGGRVPGTPSYREVSSGRTGHAEVVKVNYNPSVIAYEELLVIFMTSHDPTTLNQQGADVGSQYRSVIYHHNDEQKEIAEEVVKQLAPYFDKPITTKISPAKVFHPAENYHQDYYNQNSSEGYCTAIITPKLAKLRKMHGEKLKVTV